MERYGFSRDFIREKPAAWLVNRRVAIDPSKQRVDWMLWGGVLVVALATTAAAVFLLPKVMHF